MNPFYALTLLATASLAYAGTKVDQSGGSSGGLVLPGGASPNGASLGLTVGNPSLLGPSTSSPQRGGSFSFGSAGGAPSLSGTTNFGILPGLVGENGATLHGNTGLTFVQGGLSGASSSLGRPAGPGAGSVGAAPGLTGSASSRNGAGFGPHGAGGSLVQPGYYVSWSGAPTSYGNQGYGQAPYLYGYGTGPSFWAGPTYGGYGYDNAGYGSGFGLGYGQGYGGNGAQFIPGVGSLGYYPYSGGFGGASSFGAAGSQVSLGPSSGRSSAASSASGSSSRAGSSRQ